MPNSVHILLLFGSKEKAKLLRSDLKSCGYDSVIETVSTPLDLLNTLGDLKRDVILVVPNNQIFTLNELQLFLVEAGFQFSTFIPFGAIRKTVDQCFDPKTKFLVIAPAQQKTD